MTGNDVAYLTALYRGRRLWLSGVMYSARHCRKRMRYGTLLGGVDDQKQKETGRNGTNLISVGKTQRDQPSWGGNKSKLPPGSNIHKESHRSPKTLA